MAQRLVVVSSDVDEARLREVAEAKRERGFQIFLENLRRYAAGQYMINLVDKQAGY